MIYIIRGVPGSGKSTLAKMIQESTGADHFEADMYFDGPEGYRFDASRIRQAHEWCQGKFLDSIRKGRDVIISNTFVKKWEMEFYIHQAKTHGYNVQIITLKGEFQNVHNVPQAIVERMKRNFED